MDNEHAQKKKSWNEALLPCTGYLKFQTVCVSKLASNRTSFTQQHAKRGSIIWITTVVAFCCEQSTYLYIHWQTCSRDFTALGKSSKAAFTPTCHFPVGFTQSSGMTKVRAESPWILRFSFPSVACTVDVSTSPLPVVSTKSKILRSPNVVS